MKRNKKCWALQIKDIQVKINQTILHLLSDIIVLINSS
jgi:hypothetical protein